MEDVAPAAAAAVILFFSDISICIHLTNLQNQSISIRQAATLSVDFRVNDAPTTRLPTALIRRRQRLFAQLVLVAAQSDTS